MLVAIEDGVDVITFTIGYPGRLAFHCNVVAPISFLAIYNGITVVCTAGNFRPSRSTITNEAP